MKYKKKTPARKNDLFVESSQEDKEHEEGHLIELLTNLSVRICSSDYHLPCREGHSHCYDVSYICYFFIDKSGHIFPCRDGGNVFDCTSFDCNMRYKCLKSYCIPWIYVCDGKWDCPNGEDEHFPEICGKNKNCEGMFKCQFSDVYSKLSCIPLMKVCDKEFDCPSRNDELLCEINEVECPSNCLCLGLAIDCKFFQETPMDFHPFWLVSISGTPQDPRSLIEALCQKPCHILFLHLPGNNFEKICSIEFPKLAMLLNLRNNLIQALKNTCFANHSHLKTLNLDTNKIAKISSKSFYNLPNLVFLNLTGNDLTVFPASFIVHSSNFKILSVNLMTFADISIKIFDTFQPHIIEVTDYHICCIKPGNATCTAEIPWHISCSNLLPSQVMTIFYIVMSSCILVFNIASILLHAITFKSQKTFVLTVFSIHVSDLVCIVYVSIVWISSLVFADTFFGKETWWKSSVPCFTAFGFCLWFAFLSQVMLLFFCISRLMVVVHPMATKFKRKKFVLKTIAAIYFLSFVVTLIIVLLMISISRSLPLNLCLPFVDPTKQVVLIKVLAWLMNTQTVIAIIIPILHVVLVYNVFRSQKSVQKANSAPESNIGLVVQLVLITVSIILCWLPANIIYITVMFLETYPIEMVIRSSVGIMPINSVFNPFILIVFGLRRYLKEN